MSSNSYWDQQQSQTLDSINKQYDAQKAQLDASKAKQLADLANARAQGVQQYNIQANNTDINYAQQAQKLREMLAGAGALYGGQNVTANLNLSNQRANAMNGITSSENNFLNNNVSQVNTANNSYNANLATLQNTMAADRIKAIQQIQQQRHAEELAAQQEAARTAAARVASSSSISNSNGNDLAQMAWEELQRQYANGNFQGAASWLAQNRNALINSIGQTEYNKLGQALTPAQKSYNQQRSSQAFERRSSPW